MLILREGDKGNEVKRLQHLLNQMLKPTPNLREDGDLWRKTYDAVVRFQASRSLKADGVVGPQTWTAFGQKLGASSQSLETSTARLTWIAVAVAELGIHEYGLPGSHNARIIEYHNKTTLMATTDETPWCSSFVNWAISKAGYVGTNDALAKSWLSWGNALSTSKYGAVTVIKKKGATQDQSTGSSTGFHVGFFISASSSHVRLLGGNQADQVKYSNFLKSAWDIKGYRWPA